MAETVERAVDGKIDVIVGTASSGISLATYLAQRFKLPIAYVRSSAKSHGKGKQIEGVVNEGARVLLVSDIMSTEQDIPTAVKALKENKNEIVYCIAIFSNNLGAIEKALDEEKVPSQSLTDLDTLLTVASVKRKISDAERRSVAEWMKNPAEWDARRRERLEKTMADNREKIAGILLKIKAVTLNAKTPYRFVSGILSPIYTDNRLLMSYPAEWRTVMESFANTIIDKIGMQNVDVIAGTATAGIPHAAYLSEYLGLPMVYVKSSKDDAGVEHFSVEGALKKDSRVVIVEDLISTGGSSINSVKAIREAGGIVDHCLAIFTYNMEKARIAFETERVALTALTDIGALVDVASRTGYIQPDEKEKVLEWAKDSAGWGKKMGFE
jgi:orotate phosphoribosyltransferase